MMAEKCVLKLAMGSRLCDNLISKELLILSTLLSEPDPGLRVSDIHALLGGNKSWVSNLCSRCAIAGLADSIKDGREVYYHLTPEGQSVAKNAYALIQSLVEIEKIPYKLSDNSYLLYRTPEHRKESEINKFFPSLPIHTHKGALLYTPLKKMLHFVGKDKRNKLLCLELPLTTIESLELGFDDYYKRRKKPRFTPLIIRFKISLKKKDNIKDYALHTAYFFTNYRPMGWTTQNLDWFKYLEKEINLLHTSADKSEALPAKGLDMVPST
ncbi:MAG: hypothetical protein ACTSRS_17680 [Candidatus Helarchaeota archaeon]